MTIVLPFVLLFVAIKKIDQAYNFFYMQCLSHHSSKIHRIRAHIFCCAKLPSPSCRFCFRLVNKFHGKLKDQFGSQIHRDSVVWDKEGVSLNIDVCTQPQPCLHTLFTTPIPTTALHSHPPTPSPTTSHNIRDTCLNYYGQ